MPVATLNLFCRLGALSRRQQLRAFDKDADGTLLGEGIGAVVLKRAEDARPRRRPRVRGDPRRRRLQRRARDERDGAAHRGRGAGAAARLRRRRGLAGQRRPDRGARHRHTGRGRDRGAGADARVRGARRRAAALRAGDGQVDDRPHDPGRRRRRPDQDGARAAPPRAAADARGATQPNPELELERTPFYINTETRPWIHGGGEPRRAGINAFGFGGINAHAVLEDWEGARSRRPPAAVGQRGLHPRGRLAAGAGRRGERAVGRARRPNRELALADLAFTLSQELGATPAAAAPGARRLLDRGSAATSSARRSRSCATPDCPRIKTTSGIYYEGEPLGPRGQDRATCSPARARSTRTCSPTCACSSRRHARCSTASTASTREHPRGHLLSDWVFPRPAFSDEERQLTEARLMELDIAVEAVLTANAAVYEVMRRLVPRCDAMLGHSQRRALSGDGGGRARRRDRRAAGGVLPRSERLLRRRRRAPRGAGGGAAGARSRRRQRAADRRVRPAASCIWRWTTAPTRRCSSARPQAAARAREIAIGEGLMCEQLPYDRAVHTPLFAPFAEDLRPIFAWLPVRARERRALWSCTTAAAYPQDPQAIRELLVEHWTQPGALPRDDRGAARRRRADVHRGRAAREHDLVHAGHPARTPGLRRRPGPHAPLRAPRS